MVQIPERNNYFVRNATVQPRGEFPPLGVKLTLAPDAGCSHMCKRLAWNCDKTLSVSTAFCDNLIFSLFSINLFNFPISPFQPPTKDAGWKEREKENWACFLHLSSNSIKTRCPGTEATFIQTGRLRSRMKDFFPGEWKVSVHDLQVVHGAGGSEPADSRLGKRLSGLHIFSLPPSSQLSPSNL